jgi:hypothetical protein
MQPSPSYSSQYGKRATYVRVYINFCNKRSENFSKKIHVHNISKIYYSIGVVYEREKHKIGMKRKFLYRHTSAIEFDIYVITSARWEFAKYFSAAEFHLLSKDKILQKMMIIFKALSFDHQGADLMMQSREICQRVMKW